MAKAIHLNGGTKGTKNTLSRSHAAQKAKDGRTAKVGVTPKMSVNKPAKHNPKPGASDIKAVTRPAIAPRTSGKGEIGVGWARQWMSKHGMNAPTLNPFDRTSKPADMMGSTHTNKSTKKTSPSGKGSVTYQGQAFKTGRKSKIVSN